ncbi:unnamed protein product [Spodoptera exigua]|nr:unnamed protein product [Spodoptera exigua]
MRVGDFKLIIRNYKSRFPHDVYLQRLSVPSTLVSKESQKVRITRKKSHLYLLVFEPTPSCMRSGRPNLRASKNFFISRRFSVRTWYRSGRGDPFMPKLGSPTLKSRLLHSNNLLLIIVYI